jgi:CMP-N-acetylneuraminic acid synthetase
MIAAIIPARGGSKRLPRKNIAPFAGRPLLYYSIALAQAIDTVDRCIVTTEDAEIAHVARTCGAEVIDRPAELADDRASTLSAIVHVLETLAATGRMPEAFVLLQPNCPLRPRSLVVKALEMLDREWDSVVSVTAHHCKDGDIRAGVFVPRYQPGTRGQDMPERYVENGLVYCAWSQRVLDERSLFGQRIRPLDTGPLYALGDIDTPLDLAVTEFLFTKYRDHFDWVPAEVTARA